LREKSKEVEAELKDFSPAKIKKSHKQFLTSIA
jgi:hypothetical protein